MELKIKSIYVNNFKKFKNFNFDLNSENWNITGDNATGKTTIYDAFIWLLFGKDHLDRKDYEIKPLDDNGNVKSGAEPIVKMVFDLNGKELELKRIYREIWKTKRGSTTKEFEGHETLTYINEELLGVKKYEEYIKGLIDEEIFKILTNVKYFNNLHHTKQRNILFELVKDITEEDVFKLNPKFEALREELEKHSIESLIKIVKDRIKNINKELEELPIRIDTLLDVEYKIGDNFDNEKNDFELSEAYKKRDSLEKAKKLGNVDFKIDEHKKTIISFEREIEELKAERQREKNKILDENYKKVKEKEKIVQDKKNTLQKYEFDLETFNERIIKGQTKVNEEISLRDKIFNDYRVEKGKVFTPENCNYCGQALPSEMIADLEKKFNLEKAKTLETLKASGEETIANIEKYKNAINEFKVNIENLETVIGKSKKEVEILQEQLITEETIGEAVAFSKDYAQEIEKIRDRIKIVENQITKLTDEKQPTLFDDDLTDIQKEIERLVACRTEFVIRKENRSRISKLEIQLVETKRRAEEEQHLLLVCESFAVTKRTLYQEQIDKHFKLVKFKLFEEYISGGAKEICEATYNGIPYGAVNSACQVNMGLDIIRTLQKVYDVKVPIFIDNAEGVTEFINLNSQIIKLYVKEGVKELQFTPETMTVGIKKKEIEKEREVA